MVVDRPLSSVDWDQLRADAFQSVDRAVDRSFVTVDRAVDRAMSVHVMHTGRLGGRPGSVHRSTGPSTGICLGLLHAPFLLPLTSDLCAIFLYLLYLFSPYNSPPR